MSVVRTSQKALSRDTKERIDQSHARCIRNVGSAASKPPSRTQSAAGAVWKSGALYTGHLPSTAPVKRTIGKSNGALALDQPRLKQIPPNANAAKAAKAAEYAPSALLPRKSSAVRNNSLGVMPSTEDLTAKMSDTSIRVLSGKVERSVELSIAKKKSHPTEPEGQREESSYRRPRRMEQEPRYSLNSNKRLAPNFGDRSGYESQDRDPTPEPEPVEEPVKAPQPNFHENEEEEQLDVSRYLVPCDICGRKFMEDRLQRHVDVCGRVNTKTRKAFNVKLARVQGTEMEKYVVRKLNGTGPPSPKLKKSNWRAKHQAFINMVTSARVPGNEPPPVDPNPDYVTCPTCDRRFNEDSGKRHMPICKEKAAKKAMSQGMRSSASRGPPVSGKDKMDELRRRTAYKPPSPRKPRSKS